MKWPQPASFHDAARPLAIGALIVLLLTGVGWTRCGWRGCPDVERLRAYQPGGASKLFDRNGQEFAELRPVEAETAPLRSINKHVRDAFVAVEDQRFFEHGGVDWRRVFGATAANVRAAGVREGFSTITMQLARNVFPDRLRADQRTIWRKLAEVRVAFDIESTFSKDEILELYLSHIYFGNGARGIEAAAKYYFGVRASQLSLAQAAALAALPKGPALYDLRRHPKEARDRRDLVLTLMEEQKRVPPDQAARARATSLRTSRRPVLPATRPEVAPWFVEQVRQHMEEELGEQLYSEGLRVYTTLDLSLQQAAEQELVRGVNASSPGIEAAFVALDAQTGDVLAWIGGRDFTQSRFDRAKNARRQVGSAFKPFVYAMALGQGHMLNEQIADRAISVHLASNRSWQPQNFDGRFSGSVTLRDALVYSKNVPTVELGTNVGLQNVAALARDAGISGDMDLTPALPLGTVAVSPLELVTAYTPFATLGTGVERRFVLSAKNKDDDVVWEAPETERRKVLEPEIAYLVTDVLRDAIDRGSGAAVRAMGFSAPAAGKTGTTNNATDVWFVGYTPSIVAAVWMGHDQPRPIASNASGGRLAAPVWARIMMRTNAARGENWSKPAGVVERWIDAGTGQALRAGCRSLSGAGYREVFLRERTPNESCPQRGDMYAAARTPSLPAEEQVIEAWPIDVGGQSLPAPPVELEEAEPASRVPVEESRKAEEKETESVIIPTVPQTVEPPKPPATVPEATTPIVPNASPQQPTPGRGNQSPPAPQKPPDFFSAARKPLNIFVSE